MAAKSINIESMLNSSLDDIVKMQKGVNYRGRGRGQRGGFNSRGRVIKTTFKGQSTRGSFHNFRGSWVQRPHSTRSRFNNRGGIQRRGFSGNRSRGSQRGSSANVSNRGRGRGSSSGFSRPSGLNHHANAADSGKSFPSPTQNQMRGRNISRVRRPVNLRLPSRGRGRGRSMVQRGRPSIMRRQVASSRNEATGSLPRHAISSTVRKSAVISKGLRPNISLNRRFNPSRPHQGAGSPVGIRKSFSLSENQRKKNGTWSGSSAKMTIRRQKSERVTKAPTDAELMSRIKILAELDKVPPPVSAQERVGYTAQQKSVRDQSARYAAESNGQKVEKSLSERFSRF